jgi:spectinomycin phosphotransferase/16S rRNA (guanine(1405)-N(7))-methyltransferase
LAAGRQPDTVARVFTEPADLPENLIGNALASGWSFRASSLTYQPVGFGSHHWLAADRGDDRLFVTVDDLDARRRSSADTTDAAFGRLRQALTAAMSLRRDADLGFVVAPVAAAGGRVLVRLTERYSLVVHPYLADSQAQPDGQFRSAADRLAVLDLVIALHGAPPGPARPAADDFAVPLAGDLRTAIGQAAEPWTAGPYGACARDLLARHADGVTALLAAHEVLAGRAAARPDRTVITHGQPDAANALSTPGGYVLVDWESVLLAPPERDLWVLAESDPAIAAAYTAATGTPVDRDAMTLYRLWYDLAEIAGYIATFRAPHADSADSAEAWRNLQYFLRPAERWPQLLSA